MDKFIIEILDQNTQYDYLGFDCGEPALNVFLTDYLTRQHDRKILRGYLLRTRAPVSKVLGYYTLSGSSFERTMLPSKTQQKKVPYQNVPSVTLGRLAVDKSLHKQGYGTTLVTHAMKVVFQASLAVGIHGLFVEALNEHAKTFYLGLGFIALEGTNDHALFYPTKAIETLFAEE